MSFLTDGTHNYMPTGTIWPGIADPNLRKAYDVAIPGGNRINMEDYSDEIISIGGGEARDAQMLVAASKLGDSHLFEDNKVFSKHLYNPKEESVPNTKLLSVRDWRRG